MKAHSNLFLAIPSALAHSADDGADRQALRTKYVEDFKRLIQQLKELGFQPYCALDNCGWDKRRLHAAGESVRRGWQRLQECTQVIACPSFDGQPSGGVHIEIGWAIAFELPLTIMAAKNPFFHSPMVAGLIEQDGFQCKCFYYQRQPREVFEKVIERVQRIKVSGLSTTNGL